MTQTNKRLDNRSCCEPLGDVLEPRLFKALCEPSRLTILAELAQTGKPLSVGAIAESLPIDVSVVSRHLAILKDAGVIDAEKRGKAVYYAVRYERLAETFRAIAGAIESCCPPEAGNPHHSPSRLLTGRPSDLYLHYDANEQTFG